MNLVFTLFFGVSIVSLFGFENLEEFPQPYILETKKIEIPGHPFAFNSSIVRWNGSILLSFRELGEDDADPKITSSGKSKIGLVFLDENFSISSPVQILNLNSDRAEDARLIVSGNRLYMFYSDNKNLEITEGGFRMYMVELMMWDSEFILGDEICFSDFDGMIHTRREKNWTPFDYRGFLLLSYSLNPHRVFMPLYSSGRCETVSDTLQELHWDFGEIRGGTPAMLDGEQYLAFFHSSKEMRSMHSSGEVSLHYFMGAYTFNKEPPFELTQISHQPLVAKGFYEGPKYKPYWKPVNVVFPCGYLLEGNTIWLTFGREDHEVWIAKIDKRALLESLVPVK